MHIAPIAMILVILAEATPGAPSPRSTPTPCLGSICAAALAPCDAGDTAYAGLGVREWVAALGSPDPLRRRAAAFALGKIGPRATEAVPALTRAVADGESVVRLAACKALGRIGPAAIAAAPAMVAVMTPGTDPERSTIGPALPGLGPGVVPLLVEASRTDAAELRSALARSLGRVGPGAARAVPRLEELLRDPEPDVRIEAALALWRVARRTDGLPVLARGLGDASEMVRSSAVGCIGNIGPDAADLTPLVIRGLDDPVPFMRNYAASALGAIGPRARAAVPALLRAFRADRAAFGRVASEAIAAIGPDAIPELIAGLDEPGAASRLAAAEALGRFGPAAHAAAPRLARMAASADARERAAAALALWLIDRDPGAAGVLSGVAVAGPPDAQRKALLALAKLGPAASESVPTLIRLAEGGTGLSTGDVFWALAAIGPEARGAIPALRSLAARSRDASIRAFASAALSRITEGAEGIDALIADLGKDDDSRRAALFALYELGGAGGRATPAVLALVVGDPLNGGLAITTLASFGPAARSALPTLVSMLEADTYLTRSDVRAAILAIDPEKAASLGIRPTHADY